MLVVLLGNLGSGKTLFLVILATILERPIFSNFKLHLKNYRKLEIYDLLDLDTNINVFIDEAYNWIDSRTSGKAINRYCSYVILQSRKTFTDVFITAQMFNTIDIRFRIQANIIIYCSAEGKQVINGVIVPIKFVYRIINRETNTVKIKEITYIEATKYFQLYDTLETIDSSDKESLEYHLVIRNPALLRKKIREYSKKVVPSLNKITHPSLKTAMLDNKIPLSYETILYNYLVGTWQIPEGK